MKKQALVALLSITGCLAFGQQAANSVTVPVLSVAAPKTTLKPALTTGSAANFTLPGLLPQNLNLNAAPSDLNFSDFSETYIEQNFSNFKGTAALGPGVSGGENAIVCFDDPHIPAQIRNKKSTRYGQIGDDEIKNHVTSIIAYDLYIAQQPRGIDQKVESILEPGPNEDLRAYVERIAHRFDSYIPAISELIRHGSNAFKDANIITRSSGLARINDENDVGYINPNSCVVATMAAQYKEGGEDFLQLDGRLFNHPKHSRLSRYILFLHEAIYNTVRTYTHQTDSLSTRTLVGQIINANPIDENDLRQQYKSLGMPVWPYLITAPSALYHDEIMDIQIDLDRALEQIAASAENKQLVDQYDALIKRFWSADQYASKAMPMNHGGGYPYAPGLLSIQGDNCQLKADIASGVCQKAWLDYETRWQQFGEQSAVTIQRTLNASLKEHVLDPLSQIPGANTEAVSNIGLQLWGAFTEDDNFGWAVVKIGDGPGALDVNMTTDYIENQIQNLRITNTIP